jgi:hypothetical protein
MGCNEARIGRAVTTASGPKLTYAMSALMSAFECKADVSARVASFRVYVHGTEKCAGTRLCFPYSQSYPHIGMLGRTYACVFNERARVRCLIKAEARLQVTEDIAEFFWCPWPDSNQHDVATNRF